MNKIRAIALIVAIAFLAIGIGLLLHSINAVIGWENLRSSWWLLAIAVILILLTSVMVYQAVFRRLRR